MDEYISREATVKAFCEKCKGYYDGHCVHRGECDIDVIQTAPAADVQPMKHGRWELTNNPSFRKCSECGAWWGKEFTTNNYVNYCPRCGADMCELNE